MAGSIRLRAALAQGFYDFSLLHRLCEVGSDSGLPRTPARPLGAAAPLKQAGQRGKSSSTTSPRCDTHRFPNLSALGKSHSRLGPRGCLQLCSVGGNDPGQLSLLRVKDQWVKREEEVQHTPGHSLGVSRARMLWRRFRQKAQRGRNQHLPLAKGSQERCPGRRADEPVTAGDSETAAEARPLHAPRSLNPVKKSH